MNVYIGHSISGWYIYDEDRLGWYLHPDGEWKPGAIDGYYKTEPEARKVLEATRPPKSQWIIVDGLCGEASYVGTFETEASARLWAEGKMLPFSWQVKEVKRPC